MFKRLRNKFLILNITIITILQLAAFSGIYIFTHKNIYRGVESRLSHALDDLLHDEYNAEAEKSHMHDDAELAPNHARQLSWIFSIKTDADGVMVSKSSSIELEDEVYKKIILSALNTTAEYGTVKTSNGIWMYKACRLQSGETNICATDISKEKNMLGNLIITFAYVGILAIAIIFFISLFFANKTIKPISEAWEKQNRFIEDASHELKTPLTVINTNADVLLSHTDSNISEVKKWIYYIKDEAQRMTRLTNNLLFLARMDSAHASSEKCMFSLSDAVENVILTMEAVLYENNLKLESAIEPDINYYGNIDGIKQLVMILTDNAVKYTPNGGEIGVELKPEADRIILSVSNTGEPLSKEVRERVFDRFYRADKSRARSSGGYGLGLSIAYSICRSHGAQIFAEVSNGRNVFRVKM